MSAQSKTRPRWLWVSVWKCPRKSNAKYPHPPVYFSPRFRPPTRGLGVCGAAPASCYLHLRGTNSGRISREIDFERDSYAWQSRNFKKCKWRRWRGNIFCTESMDDQSGAFTTHSRLHGRSLKRSAPRNTHTRLFIESSPAFRPFGAATAHAKAARPGEKAKARKGHLFPPVLLRPRGSVSGLGPRQRRAKGRAALRGIERR